MPQPPSRSTPTALSVLSAASLRGASLGAASFLAASLLATSLLAGCSGGGSPGAGQLPAATTAFQSETFGLHLPPPKVPGGLYVGEFSTGDVGEYALPTKGNESPRCTLSGFSEVNGIGVNSKHVLYVPDGATRKIYTYAADCGTQGVTLSDSNGQPSDVAFDGKTVYVNDATSAKIDVFANGATSPTSTLSNSAISGNNFGDAVDKSHNVYESSQSAVIVEYAGGAEPGTKLSLNGLATPLGMDFDKQNNLLVTDTTNGLLIYASPYSGNPSKKVTLHNLSVYCKLDAPNKHLYCSDIIEGTVDAYSYPAVTYEYSISNGLVQSGSVEGIALDPANKS